MAKNNLNVSTGQQDRAKRVERAHRILDSAAALILRWGYNKTTIEDIAKQAGVAKGTIYLHWKTREDLFRALIMREKIEMAEDFKNRITEDSDGATLSGIIKNTVLALTKRPLLKAILLRDIEVMGKLIDGEKGNAAYVERLTSFNTYLEFLREQGLLRKDLNLQAQLYVFNAVFMGFFLSKPLMPKEFELSDEELANLMAETVHRTLEGERVRSTKELKDVFEAFMKYLDNAVIVSQQKLQQELES